jgi:hypothetical protein
MFLPRHMESLSTRRMVCCSSLIADRCSQSYVCNRQVREASEFRCSVYHITGTDWQFRFKGSGRGELVLWASWMVTVWTKALFVVMEAFSQSNLHPHNGGIRQAIRLEHKMIYCTLPIAWGMPHTHNVSEGHSTTLFSYLLYRILCYSQIFLHQYFRTAVRNAQKEHKTGVCTMHTSGLGSPTCGTRSPD